jgi:hypothetical protein
MELSKELVQALEEARTKDAQLTKCENKTEAKEYWARGQSTGANLSGEAKEKTRQWGLNDAKSYEVK